MNYCYESPDGGKTVYRRKVGTLERELIVPLNYEEEAAKLEVTVDYYMQEFL